MSWVSRWTPGDSRTLLLCRWLSGRCCFTLTTKCAETPNGVEIIWPVRKKEGSRSSPASLLHSEQGSSKTVINTPDSFCLFTRGICGLAAEAAPWTGLLPTSTASPTTDGVAADASTPPILHALGSKWKTVRAQRRRRCVHVRSDRS